MTRKVPVLCVVASLLLLVGCDGSQGSCPSCSRLSAENERLQKQIIADTERFQRQIAEKDRVIEKLRTKSGYLVIGTWAAVLAAFGLLAVGIAIGVKIKDEIITLKDVKRADKRE